MYVVYGRTVTKNSYCQRKKFPNVRAYWTRRFFVPRSVMLRVIKRDSRFDRQRKEIPVYDNIDESRLKKAINNVSNRRTKIESSRNNNTRRDVLEMHNWKGPRECFPGTESIAVTIRPRKTWTRALDTKLSKRGFRAEFGTFHGQIVLPIKGH